MNPSTMDEPNSGSAANLHTNKSDTTQIKI